MNKSESVVELAAALSVFQGSVTNAFKGSSGHDYNYADLGSILDMTRPLLADNGLSVVQMPCDAPQGFVGVETAVFHSSGQWIEQSYQMAVPENKRNSEAQNIGSAISYARRYALSAALGIAQTDDDASAQATPRELTKDDKAWIAACQADEEVLSQINDPQYREFIKGNL
jgi:hypothetical protein